MYKNKDKQKIMQQKIMDKELKILILMACLISELNYVWYKRNKKYEKTLLKKPKKKKNKKDNISG